MTAAEFVAPLEGAKMRGPNKWIAKCPAHAPDKCPSLTVTDGDRGVLVKCWAGCSLAEITGKLGLRVADLFFDRGSPDSRAILEASRQRAEARAARQAAEEATGRRLDVLREAQTLIESARGISIEEWPNERLDRELNRLGNAYACLESEGQ